jgi:hypothetical protein
MPVRQLREIATLVELVGAAGARAALRADKSTTLEDLIAIVGAGEATLPRRPTKPELIELAVASFEHAIDRPLSDLAGMPADGVAAYLEATGCSRGELMLYLDRAKIPYSGGESRRGLIKEAATGISRLGIFQRIAGGTR